jgi:CsoR family transcriptional regulator, copper-sensing transcriptional repressor
MSMATGADAAEATPGSATPAPTGPGGAAAPVSRGYSATKPQLQTRLARIEGQVRGIAKMVEDDRYCIDVLTQINAVRAALDKVALGLLDSHARHCLIGGHGGPTDPEEQAAELMGAVGRMLSR